MAITINKLIGGSINIITGGGSEPSSKRETVFYFADGTSEEKLIEGAVTYDWLYNAGYIQIDESSNQGTWKNITKIEFGTGVTSIDNDAFSGVQFVDGINEYQKGLKTLTNVTIPSSVTSIGSKAFYDCSSLITVTIPSSVTRIGSMAFGYCDGLTSFTINSPMSVFRDNGPTIYAQWGGLSIDIYLPNCNRDEIYNLVVDNMSNVFPTGSTLHCSDGVVVVPSGSGK